MRFSIPVSIMKDFLAHGVDSSRINSSHVLFSDNDVMFVQDFDANSIPSTPFVAVGPQKLRRTSLNAGVLYECRWMSARVSTHVRLASE